MRRYLYDVAHDPAFWCGIGLGLWVIGLCLLGVGR